MIDLVPTEQLRFVERASHINTYETHRVLQQFWAINAPKYMRSKEEGEWRDVECVKDDNGSADHNPPAETR